MFPKKGNSFPGGNDRESGGTSYAAMIASALRKELGNSHRAAKTVMRWTGASHRSVKHWLAGHHGPGGEYLIILIRESEAVFEAVLTASDRHAAVVAAQILAAHGTMVEVMDLAEREARGRSDGDFRGARRQRRFIRRGLDDPKNDPVSDPVNDPNRRDSASTSEYGLNARQRWYLEALALGEEVRTDDLRRHWGVSEKTAKRDVAALKGRGLIEFVGSFRSGRYQLRQSEKD